MYNGFALKIILANLKKDFVLFEEILKFFRMYIYPKEMNNNLTQIILGQGLKVYTLRQGVLNKEQNFI